MTTEQDRMAREDTNETGGGNRETRGEPGEDREVVRALRRGRRRGPGGKHGVKDEGEARARRGWLRRKRGEAGLVDDGCESLSDEESEALRNDVLTRVGELVDEPTGRNAGRFEVREPRGAIVRSNARKAARGWYAPVATGAPTTTRQGEILNPALIAAPLDDEGIVIGRDKMSSSPVAHDSFTSYRKKAITSPAVVVLGDIGSGKSSLLKTVYVLRPMALRGRRCVVLDRKDEGGQGEYTELTEFLGGSCFHMRVGEGGTRLNPLDDRILRVMGRGGQYQLLRAMAERVNDGERLGKLEAAALREAHAWVARQSELEGREPTLEDITRRLGVVDGVERWKNDSTAMKELFHQAGVGVRELLMGALSDELAGLFDGPTSPEVHLDAQLTTFDISQLPVDGPATAMVLAVVHAWLLGTLRKDRGRGTNFVVEEGWDMVSGPIARQMNANQMLARGLGLSNIAAIHNIAQVPADSKAISLLKEPQTIHIYRQDRAEDAERCVKLYGLDPGSVDLLGNLETGSHLLKVGNRPEIHVEHVRSETEVRLTNTDSAMLMGRAR